MISTNVNVIPYFGYKIHNKTYLIMYNNKNGTKINANTNFKTFRLIKRVHCLG